MGSTFTNLVIWQMVASQWRVTSTPCRLYIHTFWLNVYIHSRLISIQATKLFKFFHCIGKMEQCGTKNVCKKIFCTDSTFSQCTPMRPRRWSLFLWYVGQRKRNIYLLVHTLEWDSQKKNQFGSVPPLYHITPSWSSYIGTSMMIMGLRQKLF